MDIIKICDAYSQGLRDGSFGNTQIKLENFNLQDAYDYGYDLVNERLQEKKNISVV